MLNLCVPQHLHSHPGILACLARQYVLSDEGMELTLTLLVVHQCCNEQNECFYDPIYISRVFIEKTNNKRYIKNKLYPVLNKCKNGRWLDGRVAMICRSIDA